MFKRLRLRLTLVCALSTGLVLVAIAVASYRVAADQLRIQAEERFASNLNSVFFYLRGQRAISHAWLSQTESANDMWIRIQSGDNDLMYNTQHPLRIALTELAQQTALNQYSFDYTVRLDASSLQPEMVQFQMSDTHGIWRAAVCSVPVGEHWLRVTAVKDMGPELAQISQLRMTFTLFVSLALLCLTAFSWLFSGWAVRPVEESRKQQTEFVAAASHELRSPLSVMRLSAERIRQLGEGKIPALAEKIERECMRLSHLTDDLLRLAGADNHSWSMSFSVTEPETLVISACERFEHLAAEKEISLQIQLPDDPLPGLRCDIQRIEQLLAVLLDNAMQYVPAGGAVQIGVAHKGRQLQFWVRDNGPGIPDDKKELVFQRFYRGDDARSGKEHFGIGLAVAREIAALHRGTLTVQDAPGGGALFVLHLPEHMRR